jgi:hypothetical protein
MLSATSCIKNRCVISVLTLGDHSYSMLMVMFHSCMCSMLYNEHNSANMGRRAQGDCAIFVAYQHH